MMESEEIAAPKPLPEYFELKRLGVPVSMVARYCECTYSHTYNTLRGCVFSARLVIKIRIFIKQYKEVIGAV